MIGRMTDLVLLAVDLVDRIAISLVYYIARRWFVLQGADFLTRPYQLFTVQNVIL